MFTLGGRKSVQKQKSRVLQMAVKRIKVLAPVCYAAFLACVLALSPAGSALADGSSSTTFSGGTAPYQVTGLKPNSPNAIDVGSTTGGSSATWRFEYLVNPRYNHSGDNYLTGSAVYNFKIDIAMGNSAAADLNFVPVLEPIVSDHITTLFYITRSQYQDFHYYLEFSLTSVLDNYYCPSNTLYNIPFHIDVITHAAANSSAEFSSISNSITVVASSGSIVQSASPDQDLAAVIAAGINASSDIDSILATLNAISGNTQLLSSVLYQLEDINTILSNVYTNVTLMQSHLYKLAWAIVGVRPPEATGDIATITFNRWVDIISAALDKSKPDTSEMESAGDKVQDVLDQNEEQESKIYADAGEAIGNIDWNFSEFGSSISTVTAASVWLLSLVDLTFDVLGPFQYVIIVSLTLGLIVVVLGSINRVQRALQDRSERNDARD